jgi:thioredoxin-related protein
VIVLLYDPNARVDDYSLAETQLGAKDAGAGFLAVDVMNQRQASPFTTAYGVLQDPTVLFFKRPGKLALKLVGYADHDTIAQAAKNAALGLGTVASS